MIRLDMENIQSSLHFAGGSVSSFLSVSSIGADFHSEWWHLIPEPMSRTTWCRGNLAHNAATWYSKSSVVWQRILLGIWSYVPHSLILPSSPGTFEHRIIGPVEESVLYNITCMGEILVLLFPPFNLLNQSLKKGGGCFNAINRAP